MRVSFAPGAFMLSSLAQPSQRQAGAALRLLVSQPEGLLQVHTAAYRGSCPSVFSQALRSAGLGSTVLVSQFLRGGVDQGPSRPVQMCGRLTWLRPALAGCLNGPEEEGSSRQAVQELWQESSRWLLEGAADLVVLDELGLALAYGLLDEAEVVATLGQRPSRMDVILTGPEMPASLMALADQVTELRRDRC
ncbi:MAG TPA: ATP--corrinoid adenosyltransferase [Synechococcales bacterium UBA8138]|nr:ATP--corrinoid adenosyltransferase [Synechococcales bacterium UBA8138]